MMELLQNLIDGLGRGSIYALLALGIAVIFGVMSPSWEPPGPPPRSHPATRRWEAMSHD